MSAHIVHELPVLVDARGRMYSARVLGALAEDGSWDGVIEFFDQAGHAFATGTETHQPSLSELIYWSTSLTRTNVERALARAKAAKTTKATKAATKSSSRTATRPRSPTRRTPSTAKQSSTRTRRASGAHARPR